MLHTFSSCSSVDKTCSPLRERGEDSFARSVFSERKADLALLRMLGAPPGRLIYLLVSESAWLSILGLVASTLLSQTVLFLLQMLMPAAAVPLWQAGVFSPSLLWLPLVVVMLMTATLALPIWRTLKLDVLLLLKRN